MSRIEVIATQLGVSATHLKEHADKYPKAYSELQTQLEHFANTETLSGSQKLSLIQGMAIKASNKPANASGLKLSRDAFSFIGALGSLMQNRDLARISNIGANACKIYESYQQLNAAMSAVNAANGVANASIGSIAMPVLGMVSGAISIFSSFMDDDDDGLAEALQAIMEQLQHISKQIEALHKDMLEQFKEVHEHLQLIHDNMRIGFNALKLDLHDFRYVAMQSLKELAAGQRRILNILGKGQKILMLQSLEEASNEADRMLEGYNSVNNKDLVQQTSNNLVRSWALAKSSSPMLNGGILLDNCSAKDINTALESANLNKLQGMLGFLKQYAIKHLNINFQSKDVFNVGLWHLAVHKHLRLMHTKPKFYCDSGDHVRDLDKIIASGNNTVNFIKEIQNNKNLFTLLFKQYEIAVKEVNGVVSKLLQQRSEKTNMELKLTREHAINLEWDSKQLGEVIKSIKYCSPTQKTTKCGNGQITVDKVFKDLYSRQSFAAKCFLVIEKLHMAKIYYLDNYSYSYRKQQVPRRDNGEDWISWKDYADYGHNINIQMISDDREEVIVNFTYRQSVHIRNVDPTGRSYYYSNPSNAIFNYNVNNPITHWPSCSLQTVTLEAPNKALSKVQEFFVNHRKNLMIKSLLPSLQNSQGDFSSAVAKLDASVNLLKSYVLIAGIHPKECAELDKLLTSNKIIKDFNTYLTNTDDIDMPMINSIDDSVYNDVKDLILNSIGNEEVNLTSPIAHNIGITIRSVQLAKTAFTALRQAEPQDKKSLQIAQVKKEIKSLEEDIELEKEERGIYKDLAESKHASESEKEQASIKMRLCDVKIKKLAKQLRDKKEELKKLTIVIIQFRPRAVVVNPNPGGGPNPNPNPNPNL